MERNIKFWGWPLITAFFLAIAWATSIEEPIEVRSLPLDARAENNTIWLKNESSQLLSGLNLVLNGVYNLSDFSLAANAEVSLPFSSFTDRNQTPFPASEKPYSLEVFRNDSTNNFNSGYSRFLFE